MQYVVEFDHRSDGGPSLVGPFGMHEAAVLFAESLCRQNPGVPWSAEFTVRPLTDPGFGGRRD